MDRQTNRTKNGQTDVQKEEWTDRCTERRMDRQMYRKNGQTDVQKEWTDRRMDRKRHVLALSLIMSIINQQTA